MAADRAANEALLTQGYSLHKAGRLAEAARCYREILAADAKQFDALFLLALLHLQSRDFETAERLFGEAVALQPDAADALFARASALQELGRHAAALAVLDALLELRPGQAQAWNNRGNLLLTLDRGGQAIASYDRAIALKSDYPEAWHNRAVARMKAQDYRDAEADLSEALRLKPDYPDALEHRGVALEALGRHQDAAMSYEAALKLRPSSAELLLRRADCLLHLGSLAEALSEYDRSLALAHGNPEAWHNRGVALSRLGRLEDALESYDKALHLKADFASAWNNRGSVLLALKKHHEALSSYERALAIQPDLAEAWTSRGGLLLGQQRYVEALADFDRALSVQRNDADAWRGRGNALALLGRHEEALASYDEALRLRPDDAGVLYNRANALSVLKRFEAAARDCQTLLEFAPEYPYARGLLMRARLHSCDWRGLSEGRAQIAAGLGAGKRIVHPFLNLAISDSMADQLRCARIVADDLYPASPVPRWRGERYRHDRIRVAYLSADFYTHATAFLMAGVFEHHDRARFETFAVSFGPNEQSEMRARLEAAFDRFLEVGSETDSAVAAMLREMEIDIAVDLKGYTGGARPGILALRPAPDQIHYLGYPGTSGAQYIDYLLADAVVVPLEHRAFYTEQIVDLPDSYQCNDSRRPVADHAPSRSEAGLPERALVFCCFNSSHKIMPEFFDIWMRLLAGIEGSVLWLFEENPAAAVNLRREAESRGISPERLIFAKPAKLADHLARLRLADLVLDTLPYGAHTTASDALWMGVPVLTCLGATFAGRVAASLLSSIGIPELIAASPREYEARALELARNVSALEGLKAKLAKAHDISPIFDTARITRNIEAAYKTIWERQQRGEQPASFAVQNAAPSH
jgi:protein O-GlcNAc transferase